MKNNLLYFGIIILIVINLLSSSEITELKSCKDNCFVERKLNDNLCNDIYNECFDRLGVIKNNCNILTKKEKNLCLLNYRTELKQCNNDKKTCIKNSETDFKKCNFRCIFMNKNITCLSGKYKAGDSFAQGCNICECNFNGKISCKATQYCHYDNYTVSKELCEQNNGLYQQLCGGNLFSMKCTKENYCQCSGNFNYTCPQDYICLFDFMLNIIKKGQFSQGWQKLPDFPMGNSGICVKKSQLQSCGNNICENIICDEKDCYMPETTNNCPSDCK